MRILLHIGTEKTGTSYAQMLLARNRNQLKTFGIYFPSAGKREKDMMAGRISPGNGKPLFLALQSGNINSVIDLLNRYKKSTVESKCDALLLSNENLVEAFSDGDKVKMLLEACKMLDFEKPNVLLVLRDPVSQALSLYKHRAKNGNVLSIEHWLSTGYSLSEHLRSVFDITRDNGVSITVRKYKKDSASVQNIFFTGWLRIPAPEVSPYIAVNPSLTLSELYIIRQLRLRNPSLVKEFYDRMLALPSEMKLENEQLIESYKGIIANHLSEFNDVWKKSNMHLPSDEQLVLPTKEIWPLRSEAQGFVFSPVQLNEISGIIATGTTLKFRARLFGRELKARLGRLGRPLLRLVNGG